MPLILSNDLRMVRGFQTAMLSPSNRKRSRLFEMSRVRFVFPSELFRILPNHFMGSRAEIQGVPRLPGPAARQQKGDIQGQKSVRTCFVENPSPKRRGGE